VSPLPTQMRDRWASRDEPPAGHGTVYWHVLLSRYPEARIAAKAVRDALHGIPALHMTPESWLHMTLFIAGTTDTIRLDGISELTANVQNALRNVRPIEVQVGRVLYHPEAVMLAVEPVEPLRRLRDVVLSATGLNIPDQEALETSAWVPHMTVGYSTAGQVPTDRGCSGWADSWLRIGGHDFSGFADMIFPDTPV
jgi:2'-5' RNA ligase